VSTIFYRVIVSSVKIGLGKTILYLKTHIHFYLYLQHLLSDLGEIRYKVSKRRVLSSGKFHKNGCIEANSFLTGTKTTFTRAL
jgi:hypothetical protein